MAAVHAYLSERYHCDLFMCRRDDTLGSRVRRKIRRPLAPPYASRFQPPDSALTEDYDLIWVFELWAITCVPRRLWPRVIWDKDTLMAASYASGARRARLMARWVSAYEHYALRKVKHAFLSLPSDVALVNRPRATLLPHGFEDSRKRDRTMARDSSKPIRLGFVGLLAHMPNRQALMWFVREVMPELSGVELWVAGTGLPAEEESELQRAIGVELKGYVPDLHEFYASVDVAIAPLLGGQGAPIKVMEALGHGVPVVGTSAGLRGLTSDLRQYCFEVRGDAWRDAIQRALGMRGEMMTSGWQSRYTWSAVLQRHAAPLLEEPVDR